MKLPSNEPEDKATLSKIIEATKITIVDHLNR